MSKEDSIELEGKVVEVLPNAMFKVRLPNGKDIMSHISGKLRMNYIKILQGDDVKVEISPYDLTRGRITWRMKNSTKSTTSVGEGSVITENTRSVSEGSVITENTRSVSEDSGSNENTKSGDIDTSNLTTSQYKDVK